ncbi:MAG TPA: CDP-alcohol phosphatidyltransferase family protein [Patescibacteria group bacterium]|nr:CDP-alcohol phosphatidyltransferase family protein [Patescibacteria group bacterium]
MMKLIDAIRVRIRRIMAVLARGLNRLTGGRLHPDVVTIVGLGMHVPIAILIGLGHYNAWAALLLLVFGLFDTLDGELARLQQRDSARGMLLDASTDRMKEVLLYSGAAYTLALGAHPATAVWAVAACGASLCVSYVKAKGESAIATSGRTIPHATLNKLFKDGFLTFELRMFVLIVGLLVSQLAVATIAIAILASYTAVQRLVRISKALD